jgi:multiple sugar transport system substrate-binding protein
MHRQMALADGPIPPYFQLKTLLLDAILGGEYRPGDRLPTEHELCRRYGISRTPVSRALSELAEEGVLVRQRRNGTFVNPHWLRRPQGRAEVRIVVPEGPWESMIRSAATSTAVGVSVVTVPRPSLHQFLTHAVAEGQAPDLALLDSVWLPEFAEAGFLHALEDVDERWIRQEHELDFLAPLVTANRYGGRTYAVSAFADVVGLWYRREEVELDPQVEPLRTWSELRATAGLLARRGLRHPVVMPGGSKGGETTSYCLIALLASNGASVLGAHGVTLSCRATEQVLRFVRSLIENGLMSEDVVGYEWNRSARLLADGDAALSIGGSYEALALAERLGVPLEELWSRIGFVAVPAGPRGAQASLTGTMVYGIFRQAAQPKLAMRLLEQVVSPEVLAGIALATGRIPPRRSAVELVAPALPFVERTVAMLDRAVTRPATPLYPRVSAQLQSMLETVLTGRLGPARAARRAAEHIGAITGLPVVDGSGRPSNGTV